MIDVRLFKSNEGPGFNVPVNITNCNAKSIVGSFWEIDVYCLEGLIDRVIRRLIAEWLGYLSLFFPHIEGGRSD